LISYGTLLLFGLNSFVIQFAILILIYPETAGRILERNGHILPACRQTSGASSEQMRSEKTEDAVGK